MIHNVTRPNRLYHCVIYATRPKCNLVYPRCNWEAFKSEADACCRGGPRASQGCTLPSVLHLTCVNKPNHSFHSACATYWNASEKVLSLRRMQVGGEAQSSPPGLYIALCICICICVIFVIWPLCTLVAIEKVISLRRMQVAGEAQSSPPGWKTIRRVIRPLLHCSSLCCTLHVAKSVVRCQLYCTLYWMYFIRPLLHRSSLLYWTLHIANCIALCQECCVLHKYCAHISSGRCTANLYLALSYQMNLYLQLYFAHISLTFVLHIFHNNLIK